VYRLFRLIAWIAKLGSPCGRLISWCTLLLVIVTVTDVSLRYLFDAGNIAVQELEWHLFGLVFLLSAAWGLEEDAHVRIDIFYGRFGERGQALVNIFGCLVFLLPFAALIVWTSLPFVEQSWAVLERSPDPGGLPYRFLLKSAIPLAFVLVFLQGLVMLAQNIARLRS